MYLKSSPSLALFAAYRRYRRFAYRYFYAIHLSRACTVIFDARGRKKIHANARSRFSPLFRRKRKGKKKTRTDSRSIGIGSRRFLRRGSGGIRIRHARLRKRIRSNVASIFARSREISRDRNPLLDASIGYVTMYLFQNGELRENTEGEAGEHGTREYIFPLRFFPTLSGRISEFTEWSAIGDSFFSLDTGLRARIVCVCDGWRLRACACAA